MSSGSTKPTHDVDSPGPHEMPEPRVLHGRSFDDNIDILFDEILLAEQWGRPSLLLGVHKSRFGQEKAEKVLEARLADEGFEVLRIVFNDSRSDIAQLVRESGASRRSVFFISNLDGGGGRGGHQAYRGLNLHRELFVEEAIKAVFWLTANEATNVPRFAPDFWAFRHRVVEFVSQRAAGKVQLPAGILVWDTPGSPDPFESPRSGIEAREELLRRLPQSMESLSTRIDLQAGVGHLLWTLGELDDAMRRFEAGLALAAEHALPGEKASLLNGSGIILFERGEYDAALERFQSGLQFRSSSRALLINLSATQCVLGRIQEALALGKKAVRASSSEADTWHRLAYIYNAAGRPDEAIGCLTRANELAPRASIHHVGLAVIYGTMDRTGDVNMHLAAARQLAGGEISDYVEILTEALLGDSAKAVGLINAAVLAGQLSRLEVRRDVNLGLLFDAEELAQAILPT
jgi:tetratricopeptide (TPR) repeat protein